VTGTSKPPRLNRDLGLRRHRLVTGTSKPPRLNRDLGLLPRQLASAAKFNRVPVEGVLLSNYLMQRVIPVL
jgi:hypothetical protein